MAQLAPEKIEGLILLGPVYPSADLAEVFALRIPRVKKGWLFSAISRHWVSNTFQLAWSQWLLWCLTLP
jgi:pimeloyl-ACP methyl ester carboxylesterase